ncbi:MAG TPA: MFS transporter [Acidimicrobiia bacterium]|nr:MFS transporter [Acidimicrobiia bacterium]
MATRLGANFDKLSLASGVSNIGDGVMQAAFPLLVAALTRDPLLVSGATLAGRMPWFLFALVSGALVDRLDRRKVMVLTDSMRAVGVGLFAWGVATGEVGLIAVYAIAFALGVAETFFDTSAEAFTPKLVDSEQLSAANGRLQGLEWVGGSFVGPPIGAGLFVAAGALPFALNSMALAVAAVLVASIPGVYRIGRTDRTTIRSDIGEGLRWLWGQRVLRTLAMMAGTTNFFSFAIVGIFVLYAQDILEVTDAFYGVLLASLGVGGLLGAVTAPRLVARIGSGNTLRISVAMEVIATGTFVLTSSPWIAGVLMAVFGFLITAWNTVSISLRQGLTPDHMRGRVAGASRLLAFGTQPLGALAGGAIASLLGLRAPFAVAAAVFAVMLVVTWKITSNRSIEETRAGAAVS